MNWNNIFYYAFSYMELACLILMPITFIYDKQLDTILCGILAVWASIRKMQLEK